MENSHIPWTTHTFNPWEGCTMCSPGCFNCYALARNKRFADGANWGKGAPRRRTEPDNWKKPLKWNREAEASGERPRVFCASLADWLDDEVPIEWLADLLDLIRRTPNLDWLLLTKRPQNWEDRIEAVLRIENHPDPRKLAAQVETRGWLIQWIKKAANYGGSAPNNVWVGTTVEDQIRADERILILFTIPARMRFLSCEPLLGPVDLNKAAWGQGKTRPSEEITSRMLAPRGQKSWDHGFTPLRAIDWVIAGGESGAGARPMDEAWALDLRDQCGAAGTVFHFKQWGGPDNKARGRLLAGELHDAVPVP